MKGYQLIITLLCLFMPGISLANEYTVSTSDFGGTGLLQNPTARMFDDGEIAVSFSHVLPYSRANFTLQPIDWLEVNIRYTSISNRAYDPSGTISSQSYKDKGIDFKFALADESYYRPAIALGFRDIGGTGLFASEFLVANKRVANFDFSLGIAWGYLGSRGDMNNPFAWALGKRFHERQDWERTNPGGTINFHSLFRGEAALFGGIEYQTPWKPLVLKLEYEGNDYHNEPLSNNQDQDSRFNIGATFNISDYASLSIGYERGNTLMLGFVLHSNIGQTKPLSKISDPAPVPIKQTHQAIPEHINWQSVSTELETNAGYKVSEIAVRQNEMLIRGEQQMFFAHAEGIGRAARIMDNYADDDVRWLTVIDESSGIPVKETSISRDTFRELVNNDTDLEAVKRTLSQSTVATQRQETLFHDDNPDPFNYGLGVGFKQSLGGPDRFILYQFTLDASAEYHFTPQSWWSGSLSVALLDNYDKFIYDGPSLLPRVRTDIRQYLTTSDVMMPSFQFTHVNALSDNVFSLVYAGMLETMYGGIGGEILYRPFDEPLAFGIDVNWVKQRAYAQNFEFRHYETVTGHISAYWDTGFSGILVTTSVGRYLAKDWGMTVDISRNFANGVSMGGYITRTNISSQEFGEGSFDKGIYITIPFDLLLTRSTLNQATLSWSPLTRDGGARLSRSYSLYPMTNDRDLRQFHHTLEHLTE